MNFPFPDSLNPEAISFFKDKFILPGPETFPEGGTYAVVFSSYTLLGSRLGDEIDSHDYVLRFNYAPTKDFEIDVGRKTTHRFLGGHNGQPYFFQEADERVYSWVTNRDPSRPYNKYVPVSVSNTVDRVHRASTDIDNRKYFNNFNFIYCWDVGDDAGMKLMRIFPLGTGNRVVDVYGFESTINTNLGKYHYFDDTKNKDYVTYLQQGYNFKNPWDNIINGAKVEQAYKNHDYLASKKRIKKLAESGAINLK